MGIFSTIGSISSTAMNNWSNEYIAKQQNALNYKMFNEQNKWNEKMWNLNNVYNSPSKQVERYIEGGINPLWALSGGNPGNSQALESAQWPGAVGFTAQAPDFGPLAAMESTILNGYLGIKDLNLKKKVSDSQVAMNEASAALKNQQSKNLELAYDQDTASFGTRLSLLQANLEKIGKEMNNIDIDSENGRQLLNNYKAQEDLIRTSIAESELPSDQSVSD